MLDQRRRAKKGPLRRRGWLLRRSLVAADVVGLTLAFLVAQLSFLPHVSSDRVSQWQELLIFVASIPVWIVAASIAGLYDRDGERTDHSTADDLLGVVAVVTVGTWVVSSAAWITNLLSPDPPRMVTFWGLAIVFVVTGRVVARTLARRSLTYLQNTVIVGAGDVGQLIARKIKQHREYGLNLVGFIDTRPREQREDLSELTLLGGPEDLPELVGLLDIERVVIAFSNEPHGEMLALIRSLRAIGVQVDVVPRLFEVVTPKVQVHTLEGLPVLGLPPARPSRHARTAKRALDLSIAGLTLALVSPLFIYIALRIKLDSRGPIFFRQTRLGMNMKPFGALKFRTMYVGTDDGAHREYIRETMTPSAALGSNGLYKLDQQARVTPFGQWLRRTSLDELPQLINVLKGDMSLVGPRPCIDYETEFFAPHHYERFLVPAGITGLWQVTARARSTFGEALDMDVAYARGWSLGLDIRLLFRTPIVVFRQQGVA